MKKGKVFTKSQVALALMVAALAGAVWLNMKYSNTDKTTDNTSSKYLGQAEYVNTEVNEAEGTVTDANPTVQYFDSLRTKRQKARTEALEQIEETLESTDLKDEDKKAALDKITELSTRTEKETAIETLLKAKGFSTVLAIIGDSDVNVIVKSEEMLPAHTLQIQDAVTSQTAFSASQVKIVTMNEEEIKNALK